MGTQEITNIITTSFTSFSLTPMPTSDASGKSTIGATQVAGIVIASLAALFAIPWAIYWFNAWRKLGRNVFRGCDDPPELVSIQNPGDGVGFGAGTDSKERVPTDKEGGQNLEPILEHQIPELAADGEILELETNERSQELAVNEVVKCY